MTKSGKFGDPSAQFRPAPLARQTNRRNHAGIGIERTVGLLADQAKLRVSAPDLSLVHSSAQPRSSANGQKPPPPDIVAFNRAELTTLLDVYGRKVAAGHWRDYAMDFLKDRALFSIYHRNSERPMFVVEKNPKLRNKQGQYLVTNQQGRVMKRGHELPQVLKVLDGQISVVK